MENKPDPSELLPESGFDDEIELQLDLVDDSEELAEPDDEGEYIAFEEEAPPVLTINIQSWTTPIVAAIMLILGLLGGYFIRPTFEARFIGTPAVTEVAAVTPTAVPSNSQAQSAGSQQDAAATAADREALMSTVLSQVRHFKGNPDAKITLIEFSDFQ